MYPSPPEGNQRRLVFLPSFSAWAGELVRVNKYQGPSKLPLLIQWPLVANSGAKEVVCDLKQYIHPLIVLHPGSDGWKSPQATVIDADPAKFNERRVMVINRSAFPLNIYFTKKPTLVKAGTKGLLSLPADGSDSYRYRIDTAVGRDLVTVSNSTYRLRNGSRLLILAMPSPAKIKSNPLILRMITDVL